VTVDILITLLFAVLVFLGWRSGALSQAVRIIAAVTVVVGSPFVAVVVRETVFRETGPAAPVTEMLSLGLAGLIIYVGISLAGWLIIKAMRAASKTLSKLDRLGGAAIGAVKALLLVYFLVVLVVMVQVPLEAHDPNNALRLREGQATRLVAEYHVLAPWQFPDLQRLHDALIVGQTATERGRTGFLREHPRASDFLRKQAVKALLDDEQLMAAVTAGHYHVTLADGRVRELLNDEEVVTRLRSIDWKSLRDVAAEVEQSTL
jgi:uncharacterized membrane protein required for colicin V production